MADEILIIGGVAAGLSAASRARKLSRDARITVLEQGPVCSYSACGLPLALAGQLPLERLIVHTPEFFRDQRQISVLTGHRALAIEPSRRRVRVETPAGERAFPYDRLVLATGAESRWQPSAGPRPLNLYAANTWTQTQTLLAALDGAAAPRRVVVVGGGYIGLEVAEALARRGCQVTVLESRPALLSALDPELSAGLPAVAEAAGITVRLGVRVVALEGRERVTGIATSAGAISADAVINCAGLRPRVELAAAAGVALGRLGGIAVNDRQQTNLGGIYAAGDCAETRHRLTGAPVWIPLAPAANQQGRIAGQNAAGGRPARFPGVLGTLVVPLFGWEWGRTGLGLNEARAAGFAADGITVTAQSRAGYLDPQPVTLRLIYDGGTGRALGCQLRGAPGTVAGRLNTAAAALAAGLSLEEIETLDNAYCPPLAPLYEPLAVAAHQAR